VATGSRSRHGGSLTSQHAHHGIRCSLTLHDRYGARVLGYDNAHAVRPPKKIKFAGQRLPYDHRHRTASDKGAPDGPVKLG